MTWRQLRPYALFAGAWLLARTGVFKRFPGLQWRGNFRHPIRRWRRYHHSGGRITSATDQLGRVSRNTRSGRTSVDLPGQLRWHSSGRRS